MTLLSCRNASSRAAGSSSGPWTSDMPMLLPSRAGFTTLAIADALGDLAADVIRIGLPFTAPEPGRVDDRQPWPRMRSLKTTLSIATALASTPAPMYGMPASSRKPCSVPSSPNGPWTTRKATSIASPSERRAARGARPEPDPEVAGQGTRRPARRRATSSAGLAAPTRPARLCPSSSAAPGRRAGASGRHGRCRRGTARTGPGRSRAGRPRPMRRSPRARPTGRRRRSRPAAGSCRDLGGQSPTNSIS